MNLGTIWTWQDSSNVALNGVIIKFILALTGWYANYSHGVLAGISTPNDGEIHFGPPHVLWCSSSPGQTHDQVVEHMNIDSVV